jgi:hypothetical protein
MLTHPVHLPAAPALLQMCGTLMLHTMPLSSWHMLVCPPHVQTRLWCCAVVSYAADVRHFDVAYDAFEQLAHPVYGVAMIGYRTVDCDTGAALPEGYIDK